MRGSSCIFPDLTFIHLTFQGTAMPRYAALLRGVSPMNAKMPELKAAFESAGFTGVKTLLSSGNVAFTARAASEIGRASCRERVSISRAGGSLDQTASES